MRPARYAVADVRFAQPGGERRIMIPFAAPGILDPPPGWRKRRLKWAICQDQRPALKINIPA